MAECLAKRKIRCDAKTGSGLWVSFQTQENREENRKPFKRGTALSSKDLVFSVHAPSSLCQVTSVAASDRPAGTRQFWAWAQLSSGPALSVTWLKRGERNNASQGKKSRKWKRWEDEGKSQDPRGVHRVHCSCPPSQPPTSPVPLLPVQAA